KKQKGFIKSIAAFIAGIACMANDKKGATLIEMALYIALVVIVCIAVVTTLGGKLQSVFQTIVSSL
ncbi:MAG: Flp family type IVb pilin, partial [Actinobacteria bacterium]|nr:Flp family type IVb pilin [Actinomycetota bacterium]